MRFACSGKVGEEKKKTKLGVNTKKADNFGAWYSEVVVEAELISYYNVSGEHGPPPPLLPNTMRLQSMRCEGYVGCRFPCRNVT